MCIRDSHRVELGKDARGNLTRIDNALNAMPDRLQNVRNTLDALDVYKRQAPTSLILPAALISPRKTTRRKSDRLAFHPGMTS